MGAAESSLQEPSLDFDSLNLYEVLGVSAEASDADIKVRMTIDYPIPFSLPHLWFMDSGHTVNAHWKPILTKTGTI